MRKATMFYWLAVTMGILSILLAVSSLLLWVVFPRGFYPVRALWVEIHQWGGLSLGIAALVHVAMHWNWLTRMTKRRLRLQLPQRPQPPQSRPAKVQGIDRESPAR